VSGKTSSRKGKTGEREFYRELERCVAAHLSTAGHCTDSESADAAARFMADARLGRNFGQSRHGGSDSRAGCPYAIEIKRQRRPNLMSAIRQCLAAARPDQEPVIAYRLDGTPQSPEPWHILLHMDLREFAAYVCESARARLPSPHPGRPAQPGR